MKTLIKIIMSIVMPNFGIALMIRSSIRNAKTEREILTRKEIEGMYSLSIFILIIPIIITILSIFFETLTHWSYLCILGVFISVIFIFTSKDLKN